jgi:hypothetical protein
VLLVQTVQRQAAHQLHEAALVQPAVRSKQWYASGNVLSHNEPVESVAMLCARCSSTRCLKSSGKERSEVALPSEGMLIVSNLTEAQLSHVNGVNKTSTAL